MDNTGEGGSGFIPQRALLRDCRQNLPKKRILLGMGIYLGSRAKCQREGQGGIKCLLPSAIHLSEPPTLSRLSKHFCSAATHLELLLQNRYKKQVGRIPLDPRNVPLFRTCPWQVACRFVSKMASSCCFLTPNPRSPLTGHLKKSLAS